MLCWVTMPVAFSTPFVWLHHGLRIAMLVIVGISLAIGYYLMLGPRCPRCRTRLLLALGSFGVRLWIPQWYTSCPSCGLSFDTQYDAAEKV